MINNRTRLAWFASVGLTLATVVAVEAHTTARPATGAAAAAANSEIQSGRVSSLDLKRGLLFVDGQTYRIDAREVAFSDDREDAGKAGLQSLKRGDAVTVRSIRKNGERRVVQIVVTD